MSVQPTLASTPYIGRTLALPVYVRQDLAYTNTTIDAPLTAGLSTQHFVAGGQVEVAQRIVLTWETSASVGVRTLGVRFLDTAGDTIAQALAAGQQSEGSSARYTFDLDASPGYVPNRFYQAPLPFLVMEAGYSWQIFATGPVTGDIQDGLTHTEIVIPTGPPADASVAITPPPVLV